MATIIIRTKDNIISFETKIDFDPNEMPYLCMLGYRNNCTSQADPTELNKFWNMIDDFFSTNQLSISEYVTLETIVHNGERFGI